MVDLRITKLAELLVKYSVAIRHGDRVIISGSTIAEPLLREIYHQVLIVGGHPFLMVNLDGINEVFFRLASNEQLQYIHEPFRLINDTYDVRIRIWADENTKSLASVDPVKTVIYDRARTELFQTALQRFAAGEFRWIVAPFPTNAFAQEAEMSLKEYEDFVFEACLPDIDDPIAYWQGFSQKQQRIIDWLKGKKSVHIRGNGTDLILGIEGRGFINCDGHENMPDGEIFTGPVEDSVNGYISFSYPAIYEGREILGIKLGFENGKVIEARADKNEDFLLKMLETDAGAKYLGEFAIGTNEKIRRFTKNTLFDEKISGTFHVALGIGFPETGSKNKSAIHWDLVCDAHSDCEIWVDDELFYKDGDFTLDFG